MTSWKITEPQRLDLDEEEEVVRLDVNLIAGRLNVVGTAGPARVEVSKIGPAASLDVSVDGGRLSVGTPTPETWRGVLRPVWWWLNGHRRATTDVSVALPFGATAALLLTAGAVIVSGIHGDLTVHVVSGRVTLLGIVGRLRGKVISGPIDALGCAGEISLETISGEITIADSATDRVHAKTISGAITADLDNPPRDSQIDLETTSGEITIRVREDSHLTVQLSATGGRVSSAFPGLSSDGGESRGHWGKRLTGTLGAGTGRLRASSVSGGISLLPRPADDDGFAGEAEGAGTR